MSHVQSDLVEVKQMREKGRGVFARCAIPAGTVIERVPVIVLPIEDVETSRLGDYCFFWGRNTVALALGYGSIYNHSYRPNAEYRDIPPRTKEFRALRDIRKGEEITVNYNGDPRDHSSVGFAVV